MSNSRFLRHIYGFMACELLIIIYALFYPEIINPIKLMAIAAIINFALVIVINRKLKRMK